MSQFSAQDAIEGVLDRRPSGVSAPQLASLFGSSNGAARLQSALQVCSAGSSACLSTANCDADRNLEQHQGYVGDEGLWAKLLQCLMPR